MVIVLLYNTQNDPSKNIDESCELNCISDSVVEEQLQQEYQEDQTHRNRCMQGSIQDPEVPNFRGNSRGINRCIGVDCRNLDRIGRKRFHAHNSGWIIGGGFPWGNYLGIANG